MAKDFGKIEQDILVALSDFVPRNQNQIADSIGKNHKEKSTNRVHVSRCLKNLKTFLDRAPNDMDELGKKWVLKQDVETIKQIIKKYKPLIPDFQKNDTILSMVADKHKKLVKPVPTLDWNKAPPKYIEELDPNQLSDFKFRLKTSSTFFENCLFNETNTLREAFYTVYPMTFQGQRDEVIAEIYRAKGKTHDLGPGGSLWGSYKTIYVACVMADIISGYKCQDAIEFVKKESRADVEFYCADEMELWKIN